MIRKAFSSNILKLAARILFIWVLVGLIIFKTAAHVGYYSLHKRLNFFAATVYGDCREAFEKQSVHTERCYANLESFIMTNEKARTILAAHLYLDVITLLILFGIFLYLRNNRRI